MSDDDVLKQESSYLMIEPYREFLKAEGVPLIEAYSVECPTVLLEPWPRLGGRGAYVHLTGRGDHSSVYIAEIDPGGELKPERRRVIWAHGWRHDWIRSRPGLRSTRSTWPPAARSPSAPTSP